MIQQSSTFVVQMIATLAVGLGMVLSSGCTTTGPSDSVPDPTKSPNIASSTLPTTASGGDIRGVYTINDPFIWVTTTIPGMTINPMTTANSGSGIIKFEGSSASSGTYSQTNLSLNVKGSFNLSILGTTTPLMLEEIGAGANMGFSKTSGTWKVIGNTLSVNDGTALPFAVDSKGLYLLSSNTIPGLSGNFTIILTFKK